MGIDELQGMETVVCQSAKRIHPTGEDTSSDPGPEHLKGDFHCNGTGGTGR
jgi:hypothetical protein